MSIVIIGGNERMERRYKNICKEFDCDAKVFTKFEGRLQDYIGNPDLIVLFTTPVSHTMARAARQRASQGNISLVQSHSGSGTALRNILSGRAL